MGKQEISIKADPTFWAPVEITVPGKKEPMVLEFEFKHRTVEAFNAHLENARKRVEEEGEKFTPAQQVMELAVGWKGVIEPWNEENLSTFLSNFHNASGAIGYTYAKELTAARLGN